MLTLATRLVFAFAIGLACLWCSAQEPPTPAKIQSVWAPVISDLPVDPLLVDGTLPNGLRYLILPNSEPRDGISLRLLVATGSMHENDDELGLAHFVEHMAFRGTRDFPNGKMAETLQRLGIAFGPDSTAFTSYDHTIYHLELPDAKQSTLVTALHAFREYADGVTFDPALIDKERGVILSEKATRDTPDARASIFNLQLLWPHSREARRLPIGETAQIQRFKREHFVAFYDAWYRPERMALIVVGAVDPTAIQRLIESQFGNLQARAPARAESDDLITTRSAGPNVGVFRHPDNVGLWMSLERPVHTPPQADTHAFRKQRLHRALAFAMFELRLRKLSKKEKTAFVSPNAEIASPIKHWEVVSVGVGTRISDWRAAAIELETEHRRAVQYGFTASEFKEARGMFEMQYEQSVRSASTRQSPWLAQQLVGMLLRGNVFSTPAAIQLDMAEELAATQLSDCLREFRAAWTTASPTLFVSSNTSLEANRNEIAAVFNQSRAAPVTRFEEAAVPTFAYTDFGPPGALVRDEHIPDLDVRLAAFANGTRLNFKNTTFEADTVDVRVRVGSGKLTQLQSQPGIDTLANAALMSGGVGRHTDTELVEILNSHALGLTFQVDTDSCVFLARCARRELDLLLRVIAAFLSDPSFRPEALRQARPQFGSIYSNLIASPGGPIAIYSMREMLSGDTRFGVPAYDDCIARTMGELRAWLGPQLLHGQLELSVVGDVSWKEAQEAVARTLGALPERAAITERAPTPPVRVADRSRSVRTFPVSPEIKQGAIAWFWPVPDLADIREERRCNLLAGVLGERLRQKLREELGSSYVTHVDFRDTDGFPNANFFGFYTEVAPSRLKQVLQILHREALSLSKDGPTADEFDRVKLPYLRSTTEDLRTNIYWVGTVLDDAQQRPNRIEAARNRSADNASITRAEIARLARKHLHPDNAFKFVTVPGAK